MNFALKTECICMLLKQSNKSQFTLSNFVNKKFNIVDGVSKHTKPWKLYIERAMTITRFQIL